MASRSRHPKPAFRPRQPLPEELLENLLGFIQRQFYPNHPIPFAKDRPRLLKWVILRFAIWLDSRGVTLPAGRYQAIMQTVLMEALQLGKTGQITYLPAWLSKVVESHLDHHGEEYYEEAKSIRARVESALKITSYLAPKPRDAVRELAQAARLIQPRKRAIKPPLTAQLTLFK